MLLWQIPGGVVRVLEPVRGPIGVLRAVLPVLPALRRGVAPPGRGAGGLRSHRRRGAGTGEARVGEEPVYGARAQVRGGGRGHVCPRPERHVASRDTAGDNKEKKILSELFYTWVHRI